MTFNTHKQLVAFWVFFVLFGFGFFFKRDLALFDMLYLICIYFSFERPENFLFSPMGWWGGEQYRSFAGGVFLVVVSVAVIAVVTVGCWREVCRGCFSSWKMIQPITKRKPEQCCEEGEDKQSSNHLNCFRALFLLD